MRVLVGVRVIVGVRVFVGVRVTVGVRVLVGVRVTVGVRVGVRVLVDVRVLVGVRVTCDVTSAGGDDRAIGWGDNAHPIATMAHEIINQPNTRFIQLGPTPILPTPRPRRCGFDSGARLYPIEADCGRAVEETLFLCYNPGAPPPERCQSG